MTVLELDNPDAILPLILALMRYTAEQPEALAEHAADVTFVHDADGRLTSVTVTLDE